MASGLLLLSSVLFLFCINVSFSFHCHPDVLQSYDSLEWETKGFALSDSNLFVFLHLSYTKVVLFSYHRALHCIVNGRGCKEGDPVSSNVAALPR